MKVGTFSDYNNYTKVRRGLGSETLGFLKKKITIQEVMIASSKTLKYLIF